MCSCSAIIKAAWRRGVNLSLLRESFAIFKAEGCSGFKRRLLSFNFQNSTHYSDWISRYDTLTNEKRSIIRARIKAFSHLPLISVVMPTHNSKPTWLIEAIESVRNQLYTNWELCIADDASTDPRVRQILERYTCIDDRIKVVFRESNGHISAASNSALKLASGDFIAFLDHDDLLSEHALFWVVDALAHNPEAQLIYSDEDKVDKAGFRMNPYFKCEWNEDLFYSHNIICHLGVYRTKLIRELGGLREGFEGAQDYDLALRCIERIKATDIVHIPRVLYHWRIHAGSTASGGSHKAYALEAGRQAIHEHLQRQGSNGVVEPLTDLRMYRVRYQLPTSSPLVSLIIPTRNGLRFLRRCVESILEKTSYQHYQIVLVDNGSDDPEILRYLESIKGDSRVHIIRDNRPFNYSQLINSAVTSASGEVIGLLNDDLEVITPDWLSEMVTHALRPEDWCCGGETLVSK